MYSTTPYSVLFIINMHKTRIPGRFCNVMPIRYDSVLLIYMYCTVLIAVKCYTDTAFAVLCDIDVPIYTYSIIAIINC